MCLNAEINANEIIWQNEPVKVFRFDNYEEAKDFPVRKPLELNEDISIVCVGSPDNPSDSVACCGTHPDTAGQIGFIKIYKVEPNKGMYRIYFEAGKKALLEYDKNYDVLNMLTNHFSAGTNDVIDKIKTREEKNKTARDRVYKLAKHIALLEESNIRKLLSDNPTAYKFDILTIDELLGIGRNLSETLTSVLFLVHNPTNTILLFSNGKPDCGKLVKDNANIYGGKGGGHKESARAIFPKEEYIDVFIDLIEKHLR
jgi:alanyl-tRNA synthetase